MDKCHDFFDVWPAQEMRKALKNVQTTAGSMFYPICARASKDQNATLPRPPQPPPPRPFDK